jgi:hypothetical protein
VCMVLGLAIGGMTMCSIGLATGGMPMGLVCSTAARRESRYSLLCKDNILYNKVYIIKALVFCVHILAVCMTN